MIQVLERLTTDQITAIRGYLSRASGHGACMDHDPRWLAVLHEAMGHTAMVILAQEDQPSPGRPSRGVMTLSPGERVITGYLPLASVQSRLFGRFLVSLPYLNRGGVVAESPEVAGELVGAATKLAAKLDVDYLELRHGQPVEHTMLNAKRDEKFRMVMELPSDVETLWKDFDAKVRNQIRKAEKSNLSIRWGGPEVLDEFYTVFAVNMRDLGTPVYPRKLFAMILEQFPGEAELCVVDYQGQAIAGALLIHDKARGETEVPSASSLRQFNETNANMWMYHQLLLRAMSQGSRKFDFGRSSEGSGTYRFKKQWGAEPFATVWQYHVRRGDINAARPDNPKYQRRIAMWQKLPVWATRLIGPRIVRGIP